MEDGYAPEEITFVVQADDSDLADYHVSNLPPNPAPYFEQIGLALRSALSGCNTIDDAMDADVTQLAAAIDRLWAVRPDPVPVESEVASSYLRGAVSKRFVNAALHHRPGNVLEVLIIDPTMSIVDRLRRAARDRVLNVNMQYISDWSLEIGNPRLKEKEALRLKFNMIIVCHGSKFLAEEQFVKWRQCLTTGGVMSVLAVNRAAAGNCFDVSVRDVGQSFNFGFYGKDYVERVYSLDKIKKAASSNNLRVTCYDHSGLSMIANNLPFGGEFSGKIDAWKAYEVVFFSYEPLPVIAHTFTPIGEPTDLFLSRPVPLTEEHLVSLQQCRFLVKEKTDGHPLVFKTVDKVNLAFAYRDGNWHSEQVPLPEAPLRHPLQVEAITQDYVTSYYYVDYFAPGDFLERRQAFMRENHHSWVEKVIDAYRDPDASFFKDFLNHTAHEGFVVQTTNTPFVVHKPGCFYLKGVPTVDLLYEDAVKMAKEFGLDWKDLLKYHWDGVAEISLDGIIVRSRPDKTRSNSPSEVQRVRKQVPYLQGLFSLVEVSADLGILDLEPAVVDEIRTRYRSKRSYDALAKEEDKNQGHE